MRVAIDASLLAVGGDAIGRIHGAVSLACIPSVGSSISFLEPMPPTLPPSLKGYCGLVRVVSIQFTANKEFDGILALLEDIVVSDRKEGDCLVDFLRVGYGLGFEKYD
jgi:hypothetical protein